MAGTIVAKNAVKRKSGYLYFVDGNGNVKETKMNRKGGKKGRKTCSTPKRKKASPKKRVAKKATPKKKVAKKVVRKKAAKKRTTKKAVQGSLFKR